MADRWAVALAASAAIGALRPSSVPVLVGAAALVAALSLRRPALLCCAILLCTSSLAQRSLDGLHGIRPRALHTQVTLLTDPEPSFGGVRAEVRWQGHHLELRAPASARGVLAGRLAGERLDVWGSVRPVGGDAWLTSRHIAGRLTVDRVGGWQPGSAASRLANGIRRTIGTGARAGRLDATDRSLYAGLVLGDDRAQSASLTDDFLGAGLTHLLAVSGQNVAFVLTLIAPVARRLRPLPQLSATVAVIGLFALMTRFEPSVIRASAMAALAVATVTIGAPITRLRIIALALTVLLLVDPLLVRSVGFQLSAAATVAIVVGAASVAEVLPGPAWLRDALGVTIAAQLGVAPVLLAVFGPLPVASLPANVLAVPVAGLVMAWGLTGGIVAGLLRGSAARLLHLPTRALLAWLAGVAQRSAALPLGELGWGAVAVIAVGLTLSVTAHRTARSPAWDRLGIGLAVAVLVAASLAHRAPSPLRTDLGGGVVRWHAGVTDVVVLGGVGWQAAPSEAGTLAALRRAGVRSVDLVVVADRSVTAALVSAVVGRHPAGAVIVPAGVDPAPFGTRAVSAPAGPAAVPLGALEVLLAPGTGRLVVDARPRH